MPVWLRSRCYEMDFHERVWAGCERTVEDATAFAAHKARKRDRAVDRFLEDSAHEFRHQEELRDDPAGRAHFD